MERTQPPDQPPPPGGPQAPAAPEAPPGGWQQPIAQQPGPGWVGTPLAGWGVRFGAWVVDGIITSLPAAVFLFLVLAGTIGVAGSDDGVTIGAIVFGLFMSFLILAIIALLYAPVLMARDGEHNGQTLGKQLLGIRVVRDSGAPMSFGWAALREVLIKGLAVGIASSATFGLVFLADALWPLWDDENRALHDMAVSTHVVET